MSGSMFADTEERPIHSARICRHRSVMRTNPSCFRSLPDRRTRERSSRGRLTRAAPSQYMRCCCQRTPHAHSVARLVSFRDPFPAVVDILFRSLAAFLSGWFRPSTSALRHMQRAKSATEGGCLENPASRSVKEFLWEGCETRWDSGIAGYWDIGESGGTLVGVRADNMTTA